MTTISTLVSYPVGVRSLLMEEAAVRRRLERAVVDELAGAGYAEIILPIVDFVEPYGTALRDRSLRQAYRFTDREGELVAIRADFTPMVARALAPVLETAGAPLRVFYRGDVIRCERTRLGTSREFFQIGAELVGEPAVQAEIEIIELAAGSVRACGAEPIVAITDASIAGLLVNQLGLDGTERTALLASLAHRRPGAIPPNGSPQAASLLARMAEGSLTLEDLRRHEPSREAAERLAALEAHLSARGIRAIVNLDEVESDPGYYTGPSFRIFIESRSVPVASGGRYDRLYREFGRDVAAVGFTMSLDYLEER